MAAAPPPYGPNNAGGYPAQPAPNATPPMGGYPSGYGPPPGSYPPAPPPKNKRGLWIGLGIAGLLLLCCVGVVGMSAIFGPRLFQSAAGNITGAQNAAKGYYDAVGAHSWSKAHGYLSKTLGATVSENSLQTLWTAQEISTGRVSSFNVTGTNIASNNGVTTATITGTVRYAKGTSDTKTVHLVKENGDWKISTLP